MASSKDEWELLKAEIYETLFGITAKSRIKIHPLKGAKVKKNAWPMYKTRSKNIKYNPDWKNKLKIKKSYADKRHTHK
jgi:hypothetical protein